MKRRTKRRIKGTLISIAVLGLLIGLSWWNKERTRDEDVLAAEQAELDRQVEACQINIQPHLEGQVLSWRLYDDHVNTDSSTLTFMANIDEKIQMYDCNVTDKGVVLNAERTK